MADGSSGADALADRSSARTEPSSRRVTRGPLDRLGRLPINADRIVFTCTSLGAEDLSSRVEECRNALPSVWSGPTKLPRIPARIQLPNTLIPSRYSKRHLVIKENFSHEWSTTTYENDDGVEFAMLPPLPLIQGRNLEKIEENAAWQVDVSIRRHEIPPGTAILKTRCSRPRKARLLHARGSAGPEFLTKPTAPTSCRPGPRSHRHLHVPCSDIRRSYPGHQLGRPPTA